MYPFCSTEQQAIECVIFLHTDASSILKGVTGPLAPVVTVSCDDTLRDILAGNGSGVFEPDANCMHLPSAKAHLPGFYVYLVIDHSFSTQNGVLHIELACAYKAQFPWYDGEGRLTLDPDFPRPADMSHPFAYHGLPYIVQPVFHDWQRMAQSTRGGSGGPRSYDDTSPSPTSPSMRDMHQVVQPQ